MNRLDFSFGFSVCFPGDTGVGRGKCMNRVEWVLVGPGDIFQVCDSVFQAPDLPSTPAPLPLLAELPEQVWLRVTDPPLPQTVGAPASAQW